jgi:tRNA threonylcarbamoyl adenosine modification protein (Sua5/YciO/YrdC/YwlC family)
MSQVFEVDPSRSEANDQAVRSASAALRAGRLVVFPTETVYGLAARPDDPIATGRVFEAKRRPPRLSLPLLCASTAEAFTLVERTEAASRLARRFWPGPLTLILSRSDPSRGWSLGEEGDSIGVRVPDHVISLALLAATGPLATTSANLSGHPPLLDPDPLVEAFGDSVDVYLLLPSGSRPPGQRPSTVVDMSDPREPRVLREGPIDERAIRTALRDLLDGATG